MFLTVSMLLIFTGLVVSDECKIAQFSSCIKEAVAQETSDFNVVSEENMEEVCNSKLQAVGCASDFMERCFTKGERDVYEVATGGKLKVVKDMCTPGTRINKGFLDNVGCFQKLQDEINFCNEKYKESQDALGKANMLDTLKKFYGCCALEWRRNCLSKSAQMKCDDQAADFMYYVSTVLGGEVQNRICSSSYSSCHGLHGVEDEDTNDDLEEQEESNSSGSSSRKQFLDLTTIITFPLLLLMWWLFSQKIYL